MTAPSPYDALQAPYLMGRAPGMRPVDAVLKNPSYSAPMVSFGADCRGGYVKGFRYPWGTADCRGTAWVTWPEATLPQDPAKV